MAGYQRVKTSKQSKKHRDAVREGQLRKYREERAAIKTEEDYDNYMKKRCKITYHRLARTHNYEITFDEWYEKVKIHKKRQAYYKIVLNQVMYTYEYYKLFLKNDFWLSPLGANRQVSIDFVIPIEECFMGGIPPEECASLENILLYQKDYPVIGYHPDRSYMYCLTKPGEGPGNATFYNPKLDKIKETKFTGKTFAELVDYMNKSGWLQGQYKPRNPKKYVKDVAKFDEMIKNKKLCKAYLTELKAEHKTRKIQPIQEKDLIVDDIKETVLPTKTKQYPTKIIFRSSYEYVAFNFVDTDPNIIAWSSEELTIPYISPKDNKWHRYFIDLIVWCMQPDGTIAKFYIEIKPKSQIKKPRKTARKKEETYINECITWSVNQAKWKATREFIKAHDPEASFLLWTEDHLNIGK